MGENTTKRRTPQELIIIEELKSIGIPNVISGEKALIWHS